MAADHWLLLIHQIPPKPDYFRVKVRRRLQRMGAVALKNSVYLLPHTDEALEDFQWLRREIVEDGGDATLCTAGLVEGISNQEVEAMFRSERDAEYGEIVNAANAVGANPSAGEVRRLKRQLAEVLSRDFFAAPQRAAAQAAVDGVERRQGEGAPEESPAGSAGGQAPRGATWVTRQGVQVDRVASAWLIRRFIDPDARFKFVPAKGYRPEPGELRFDMFEGEYTHEGDRCTFETLLARFTLDDPALRAVAEIVHDIDCKDAKFGREEVDGIATVVRGIALAHAGDDERLESARPVFDGLYAHFGQR